MAETTENLTRENGNGVQGSPMTDKELHDFVTAYVAACNAPDLPTVLMTHAPDSIIGSGGDPGKNMTREQLVAYLEERIRAFPDAHMWVYNHQYDGDHGRISYEWEVRATFKGPFKGIPPTNKQVQQEGRTELIIKDGKIIRETSHQDMAAFMKQIIGDRATAP